MSVVVMGMEMPVSGTKYRVVEGLEGNKYLTRDGFFDGLYYPINHLPEKHGRLIDADILENGLRYMAKYQHGERQQGILGCCEIIRLASAIIPAEEEPTIVEAEGDE